MQLDSSGWCPPGLPPAPLLLPCPLPPPLGFRVRVPVPCALWAQVTVPRESVGPRGEQTRQMVAGARGTPCGAARSGAAPLLPSLAGSASSKPPGGRAVRGDRAVRGVPSRRSSLVILCREAGCHLLCLPHHLVLTAVLTARPFPWEAKGRSESWPRPGALVGRTQRIQYSCVLLFWISGGSETLRGHSRGLWGTPPQACLPLQGQEPRGRSGPEAWPSGPGGSGKQGLKLGP